MQIKNRDTEIQQQMSWHTTIITILSIICVLLAMVSILVISYIIYQKKQRTNHPSLIESPRLVGTTIPIARILNVSPKIHRNIQNNQNNRNQGYQNNCQRQESSTYSLQSEEPRHIYRQTNDITKDTPIETPAIVSFSF